jgi:ABC-type transport system involved in multi-copper enzyme maturation permease subunit
MSVLTLMQLTLRQSVGRHRWGLLVFLVILALLPVFIAAITLEISKLDPDLRQSLAGEAGRLAFLRGLFGGFQLPLLYPTVVLILMGTALREEIQNDTIPYLWMKPLPRAAIVGAKYAGGMLVALVIAEASVLATGALLTGDGNVLAAFLVSTAFALLAYGALFLALSLWVDHALLWGFSYLLGWEEIFSRISTAASQLSIRHYAQRLGEAFLGQGQGADASWVMSAVVLLGITVALLALSALRFSRMEFTGGGKG